MPELDDITTAETDGSSNEEQQAVVQDEFPEPGVLAPWDYSPEENAELSDEEIAALKGLCKDGSQRSMAARRMEIEQTWKARMFERGYQYLLRRRGGGWQLPGDGSNWSNGDRNSQFASFFETNVYGTHCDILTSALVRDIPECRFEPFNPDWEPDVTAAETATDYAQVFSRNNNLKELHTTAASYMCTDGRVLFYTRHVLDAQRFGFVTDTEVPETPETEQTASSTLTKKPRGQEITEAFGILEHRVPFNANSIHDMTFVQLEYEIDMSLAKATFPQIADKITAGGAPGNYSLDRIARANVRLALQGQYVTGDSYVRDVTFQRTWFRPAAFFDEKINNGLRASLLEKFPNGCLVVFIGDTFAFARKECMDDHIHILHAKSGTGQNRRALCSSLISVQERLNNWLDLLNDYFIRTVPQKWFDSEAFNLEALRTQDNVPGGIHGFQRIPGVPWNELVGIEPVPTNQPAMPEFINFFFNEYPQMLSGALPSLFGAESNTDTVGGIAIQRDQALGRLSTPWGALQLATATYFRQAVMCAAACREALGQRRMSEVVPGRGKVEIEVSNLKGNVLCFPESDSNFPETWIQRSSRLQQMLSESQTNPFFLKLLTVPANVREVKDAIGLRKLRIPEADAMEKQQGELEVLRQSGPQPNPAIDDAKDKLKEAAEQAEAAGQHQQFEATLPKVQELISQLPPMVSTVPVMQDDSEDHATEAEVCREWLNSAEGRRYKNGDEAEKEAWENVHLHYLEHKVMAKKIAAENAPEPDKKVSLSVNAKDMPPNEAAAILEAAGIPANAKDFQQEDAVETEKQITVAKAKHPAKQPSLATFGGVNETVRNQVQ